MKPQLDAESILLGFIFTFPAGQKETFKWLITRTRFDELGIEAVVKIVLDEAIKVLLSQGYTYDEIRESGVDDRFLSAVFDSHPQEDW